MTQAASSQHTLTNEDLSVTFCIQVRHGVDQGKSAVSSRCVRLHGGI
ncbi:hypothetical protein PROFUN_11228 [Planoprotostelium fungivorum]|uniref:Uncharacterized protein n=1 Tax=Planoprotostelium fungivorum TaxID=1890364 RepID=A0A2P6NA35_9EUKA|nr:hypothetical protein PROFUN_11228 [Planoprotostelium fungivorum]